MVGLAGGPNLGPFLFIFSLTISALDHSATAPPLLIKLYRWQIGRDPLFLVEFFHILEIHCGIFYFDGTYHDRY